ncbi:hypothetical protein SAMN05216201_10964 [Pseudomonas linyingensis]|uniref:Uncharacterized protein n=1 Tax=Pseudomonas linyingensis TaxID=915471 RepID=A0A1H6YYD9_9PSED|nr:hypothetical protein [Pseudomonas linyingensis]SEJ46259.1 hypothetical protein SAMN05216201_10964 [Pseudomonas linyingensis]
MARRRHKPLSPIAWLLGVIISVLGAYIVYQVRVAAIENMAQRQIERSQAAVQKIQLQQQVRQNLIAPRSTLSPDELARQETAERRRHAELVTAARLRQAELAAKDDAWDRFYQPSRACMYPESNQRKLVCEASANKARERFEAAWKAGQLQSQR